MQEGILLFYVYAAILIIPSPKETGGFYADYTHQDLIALGSSSLLFLVPSTHPQNWKYVDLMFRSEVLPNGNQSVLS